MTRVARAPDALPVRRRDRLPFYWRFPWLRCRWHERREGLLA
jgi:hypothetical protein